MVIRNRPTQTFIFKFIVLTTCDRQSGLTSVEPDSFLSSLSLTSLALTLLYFHIVEKDFCILPLRSKPFKRHVVVPCILFVDIGQGMCRGETRSWSVKLELH